MRFTSLPGYLEVRIDNTSLLALDWSFSRSFRYRRTRIIIWYRW